jgi:hypothetical protein
VTPDSMESYRQLSEDIAAIKGQLGRIEGLMDGVVKARQEARDEHNKCRQQVDAELSDLDVKYKELARTMQSLIIWWRAAAAIGGFAIVVLGTIATLTSLGVAL